MAGYSYTVDPDPNYCDAIIWKYDMNGNLIWNETWDGSYDDYAHSITVDGSYIYVAGSTESFGTGYCDAVILKYDLNGNLIWNKTWGRIDDDGAYSITVDSSYIYVAGVTESFGAGSGADAFVLKTDLEGGSGVISEFSFFIVPIIMMIAVFAFSRVKMQVYRK
jgi:hypothetical protein